MIYCTKDNIYIYDKLGISLTEVYFLGFSLRLKERKIKGNLAKFGHCQKFSLWNLLTLKPV